MFLKMFAVNHNFEHSVLNEYILFWLQLTCKHPRNFTTIFAQKREVNLAGNHSLTASNMIVAWEATWECLSQMTNCTFYLPSNIDFFEQTCPDDGCFVYMCLPLFTAPEARELLIRMALPIYRTKRCRGMKLSTFSEGVVVLFPVNTFSGW